MIIAMTNLFSKRGQIVLLVVLTVFGSSACLTLTPGSPASTQTSPATTQSSPAGAPTSSAATQTPPVTTEATPEFTATPGSLSVSVEGDAASGPGPFSLLDTKAGLADLTSYQATLKLTFQGTQAGTAQQWSKTFVMLTSKEPAARQLTLEKTGDLPDLDPLLLAEMDGAAYERLGTSACNATLIKPENSLAATWEPAGFLTAVNGADAAGSETVNGVAADHYTFDERAFGPLPPAQSTGALWVASSGGYIVKYTVTTTGSADYFGEGLAGTLSWDYELTNANQPLAIQLPPDCPAGVVTAPQLPDAANVQNVTGLLSYDTASSPAAAAAFYQAQLPPLGWTLLPDPVLTDTTALLDFTQSGQHLTIIITAGDAATTVTIELGNAAPSP